MKNKKVGLIIFSLIIILFAAFLYALIFKPIIPITLHGNIGFDVKFSPGLTFEEFSKVLPNFPRSSVYFPNFYIKSKDMYRLEVSQETLGLWQVNHPGKIVSYEGIPYVKVIFSNVTEFVDQISLSLKPTTSKEQIQEVASIVGGEIVFQDKSADDIRITLIIPAKNYWKSKGLMLKLSPDKYPYIVNGSWRALRSGLYAQPQPLGF